MKANVFRALSLCVLLGACAQTPNTKKLAVEGHATLYNNGAFQVPMTTIHLIPPAPDAKTLALEMAGMRARQSFQESIQHARESVDFAGAGIDKSLAAGRAVAEGTDSAADKMRGATRFGGRLVAASPSVGSEIIAASVSYAKPVYTATRDMGEELASGSVQAGAVINDVAEEASADVMEGTASLVKGTSRFATDVSGRHASYAWERFVKGYVSVPGKLGQRVDAVADSGSFNRFAEAFQSSNQTRSALSDGFEEIVVDTVENYADDVGESFSAVADEMSRGKDDGYTLAAVKSLRWVLQGIFWDATIKPAGRLVGASLGYVTTNAVVFPAIVVVKEGLVVANVAVQVVWNSAAAVYDVTAPTATAALVGVFSAVEFVGGQALAGGEAVVGGAVAAGTYGAGKVTAGAVAAGGYIAGKSVQYVAAPLSTVGVVAGGTTVGVVAGTATAASGAAVATAGVVGEAATQVVGKTSAVAVAGGGSAVSVAAGAALGAYELTKAVVVPAGYELGAGIVLGYGTMSQLGAHAVLGVSDAAYLVLSLEGPRWVVYAVTGNLDKGDELPTGTVLDLKAMQESGETFRAVPVSEEEMKRVVEAVYGELPVTGAKPE